MFYEGGFEVEQQDYASRIDALLSRPLTPEAIDTYADDALDGLINVVAAVDTDYISRPTYSHHTSQQREEAAFNYFGLSDISSTLDYVADKVNEIHLLDKVIDSARTVDYVAVPPDVQETINLKASNGSFENKQTIPRLKTLLYILSSEFGIDIEDASQLELTSGQLSSKIMRKSSYYLVEAHILSRSFLICDETGNMTYAFDQNVLDQFGISGEDLLRLTKSDLYDLVASQPAMGKSIGYSKNFVGNIVAAIDDPSSRAVRHTTDANPDYVVNLVPKFENTPEDYLKHKALGSEMNFSNRIMKRALAELAATELFGEVAVFKSGGRSERAYSPAQQGQIRAWLHEHYPRPPEGYLSRNEISLAVDVSEKPMLRVLSELHEAGRLGEKAEFLYGSQKAAGYSKEEQAIILNELKAQGLLVDVAPEDYISMVGLEKQTGLTRGLLGRVIDDLVAERIIESPVLYRFDANRVKGYSPEQQAVIIERLAAQGLTGREADYMSLQGLFKLFDVSHDIINRTIDELVSDGDFGDIKTYPWRDKTIPYYSATQQQLISQRLNKNGLLPEAPPEGYVSLSTLAKQIGCSFNTLQKRANRLRDDGELGPETNYKFKTRVAVGFSPEQQARLHERVEDDNALVEMAPEEFLSAAGVAKKLQLSQNVVTVVIRELVAAGELEVPEWQKFGSINAQAYSPKQQGAITYELWSRGSLLELAPEGYLSLAGLTKAFGFQRKAISKVIDDLLAQDKLGSTSIYKFGSAKTIGFSPEQQELIRQSLS